MRKNIFCIWLLLIFILFQVSIFTSCIVPTNPIDEKIKNEKSDDEQAVESAIELFQNRLKTEPYNFSILDSHINEFKLIAKEKDVYKVSGEYDLTYGCLADGNRIREYINVTVIENFEMVKGDSGGFKNIGERDYKIIASSIDGNEDELVMAINDAKYIPFMTMEKSKNCFSTWNIANELIADLITHLGVYQRENTTFVLSGEIYCKGITPINLNKTAKEKNILAMWEVDGGFKGLYCGYMKDFGYSFPFFWDSPDEVKEARNKILTTKPFYLIQKEEGYYLYSQAYN